MPVEPHVFLSYGRPDKGFALQISSELWRNRIECYNYLAKPVMDRLGSDGDHLKHVFATRFLVAIVSAETHWRELVMEEILTAYRLTQDKLREIPLVYIAAPKLLAAGPYPRSNEHHVIDPLSSGGPAAIAEELIRLMGSELVERCRKAWEINRTLYPEHWKNLDETLRAAQAGERALPDMPTLVAFALEGAPVTEFILEDVARITSDVNKSIFISILSMLWRRIDDLDARVLGSYVRGGVRPEALEASLSEVAPKVYAPDEAIETVSSVLRGAARIINAINRMQCAEAFDVARRYAWPATRQALLCAVYAAAAELGDDETRRSICEELGLPGFERQQPRPSWIEKASHLFSRVLPRRVPAGRSNRRR